MPTDLVNVDPLLAFVSRNNDQHSKANGKMPPVETKPTEEQVLANMTPEQKQLYAKMLPADKADYLKSLMQQGGSGDGDTTLHSNSNNGGSHANGASL